MYIIEVIITNKENVRDPEGETIHRSLVIRRGFNDIERIKAGKYLEFRVNKPTCKEALEYVKELCYKLRIYNPVVHDIKVRASGSDSCD